MSRFSPGFYVTPNTRLISKLAEGGMGSVWVAENLSLGTRVAVKLIDRQRVTDELRERFQREARAAGRLKSPHVVQIFDYGVLDDGTPYMVMELLQGDSLAQILEREGRLPMARVVKIVHQIALALTAAHETGVIHRDIKPANVHVSDNGGEPFVKVLDFGLAKIASSDLTRVGASMGTPLYMSPEQLRDSKDVDVRADLWSLAVLTYEAITGTLPFDGDDAHAFILMVLAGEFPLASSHLPGAPLALDAWFRTALNVDRDARFSSAREMSDALARTVTEITGAVTTLQPPPPPPPVMIAASPPRQEAPATTNRILVIVVALLGAIVVAGVLWFVMRDKPRRSSEHGTLTLICKPRCTKVIVGGRPLGASPVFNVKLPVGTHQVTCKRLRKTKTVTVKVTAGKLTTHSVSMK
jgi:serine/threonine protein kinase